MAYLTEPNKTKITEEGSSSIFSFCAAEMQGWRKSMEDAHLSIPSYAGDPNSGLFAVFDGHGGKLYVNNDDRQRSCRVCEKTLRKRIAEQSKLRQGRL